jgi:hypothetical protein
MGIILWLVPDLLVGEVPLVVRPICLAAPST